MSMAKTFAATILALALSAASVSSSMAQDKDEGRFPMGMMGGGCPTMGHGVMGQGGMWGHRGDMSAVVDGRLAYLKDELKITDTQTEVWNGYAEAARSRATVMQAVRANMMEAMQKGGAVERMDVRIASMEAMLESMKAVKPAIERLYSALAPEQKKAADQLIGVECGAM
jgi:hypothetical protein